MKRIISYFLTFAVLISNLVFAPGVLAVANANDEAYYESVLTANDTYFINPAWDTKNLAEGTDITIWFRGKNRTLKFDKSKHFASYADLYTAVYENDTVVNLNNYATFIPTFIFAPGTYSEYIHIPSQATILGAQAGISPNEALTDEQKTLDYVEHNKGWAKNPDRLGTQNETIFTGYVHFTTRDYSASANASYSYNFQNYAYKYAYLLEKAYADDSNFVYNSKIDGVVIGSSGRSGPISVSNMDSGKSMTWQVDKPLTSIKYKAMNLDIVNTISESTDLLAMSWDSSYSDVRFNVENLRSEQIHASNSYELFRGYFGGLKIKNSYIANAPGKLTRTFGEYIVQRVLKQTVEITGNIFYNNDTAVGGTDGKGELLCFDSRSASPVTASITKNVFYNAHNNSAGLLRYQNQNANGSLTVDFSDNIIHHDRSGQNTLITIGSAVKGKTSVLTFNRNKITGVITKIVADTNTITGPYNFNFNENFLGATKTSEGVMPTFNVNGTSQDASFSWTSPTYYTDYAMTNLVDVNNVGLTFDKYSSIVAKKELPAVPHTFEAWVRIPESVTTAAGAIVSNNTTQGAGFSYFDFAIERLGIPRVRWFDSMGVQYETEFTNVNVNTGEWTHVAIVFDETSGIAKCYINGEYADVRYYYPNIDPQIIHAPLAIGSNHVRDTSNHFFKGRLKGVDLYSDVRTADEIKSDYENGVNLLDDGLIASYDLSVKSETGLYLDASTNAAHAIDGKFWYTEDEMDDLRSLVFDKDFKRAYNIAVIGDTQMTTREDSANGTTALDTLYKYIVDNVDDFNTQYVIGVGDITDNNTEAHWGVAKKAITQMDGKIGYSLVRGNHDVENGYIVESTSMFNKYFANHTPYTSQFTGQNGGVMVDGSVHNTWTTFKMGTVDYLVLNIDWYMSDAAVEWAKGVVESHPDHKIIVATHSYISNDGTHINDNFKFGASGYRGITPDEPNNDGDDLWQKFISQYENIQMVLCGHIMSERIVVEQRKGVHGNTVTEILVNQQGIDAINNPQAGVGFVTNFYFNEDQTKLEIETYATGLSQYYRPDNQLTIDLTAEGEVHTCVIAANKPMGEGTQENPYLVSDANNLLWIADNTVAGSTASLDGVYFKQTNDIDLKGQTIRPIGVYFNSDTDMQAFGGMYDGNGFAIKNGTVTASKANQLDNRSFGYGLFGVIYGAEIKNVVLDNMTVMGRGVSGVLVGRACAKLDGSSSLGFNKVTACVVKDNCKLPVQPPAWRTPNPTFDTDSHTGVTGSFVGMAYATEISDCVSYLTMNLPAVFSTSGGIAGSIGYDSAVDNCIFAGTINVVDNASKCNTSLGGIVGYISPTASQLTKVVAITNCVNKGNINYTADTALPNTTELWVGGILGSHTAQSDFDSQADYKHLMENCYNLGEIDVADAENVWVGGLVGKGSVDEGSTQITLWVKDSASVEVDACGGVGTNEYRYDNTANASGEYGVSAVGDTVTTKTAQQMDADVREIEERINKLLYKAALNLDTGKKYDTLAEALASAEDGDTVTLLDDINETTVSVLPGVTLDLGGHKLTARFVTGFEDSNIIDSNMTEFSGIYVAKKYLEISENNAQLPIYDAVNGCYVFTEVDLSYTYYEDSKYYFGPETADFGTVEGERVNALLRQNSEDTGVEIIVHLDWETDDYFSTQDFTYKSNYVDEYFTMANSDGHYENVYFYARFIGDVLKQADTITVTTIVESDRGAQFKSESTEFSMK